MMFAGVVLPLSDWVADDTVAESVPSWVKLFRFHEGLPSSSGDYDWLNTSGLQNPLNNDYDGDGFPGITMKKYTPADRWRHFWVMDPPVNEDVRILGEVGTHIWAAARDNAAGVIFTVTVSDMGPGEWGSHASWDLLAETTVTLTGPDYDAYKAYDATLPSVDYTLPSGHRLVVTMFRADTENNGLLILYDDSPYDSYITVPVEDFVCLVDAWTEDDTFVARDVFSDVDAVTVRANVTNPFGAYDIAGASAVTWYASNVTVAVPSTSMSVTGQDPSASPAWTTFMCEVGPLTNGTYILQVFASDAQGSPYWMNLTISVVTVDHFAVETPEAIVAGASFGMTVTAMDASESVISNWRGTVSFEAFKTDGVTPGSGSLSVSSVEFTGDEGGTVTLTDQSYDFGEEEIVIRAMSSSAFGWSDPTQVFSGPVVSIVLDPSEDLVMTAGDSVTLEATGFDSLGNENWTWSPSWSLTGEIGTISGSGFSVTFAADSAGSGTVTCSDLGTGASASIQVTVMVGPLSSIAISPSGPLTIREGQSVDLSATGYDSTGNIVPLSAPIWYTDTSGVIIGTGATVTYRAGFIPEVGSIAVSVGSISASLSITVANAANGPWLSTIPVQIANEDSTWSLNLGSYWHHVNGTSGLRWYAEGVNISLYLITHDQVSEAIMGFVTQPDKFGSDSFRLWVRDPDGFSTYQDIEVNILPVNDRPVFVHNPPTEYYVKFDTPYSFDFNYYVWDVDNDKSELSMSASSSSWGSMQFTGLIGGFLFTEKSGKTSYFETMKITLTDAAAEVNVDSSNSNYLNIVVWVTDNTPPSLLESLPDVTLNEGDEDIPVFDLDDYFFDLDADTLIYRYGFENIVVAINSTTHVVFMSAPYEWSGVTDGTFTAVDPEGAFKTDTVVVTVLPVNDPPAVVSPGSVHVRYDVEYRLDADIYVSDPDHSISQLAFSFNTAFATYSDREIVLRFPPSLVEAGYTSPYTFRVVMTVEDPEGASGSCGFDVVVSDNYPPARANPAPYPSVLSFPEDSYLNNSIRLDVLFFDLDGESLDYTARFGSANSKLYVTIYPSSVVNFTAAPDWYGYETVTFTAFDSHLAWISWTVAVVVTPVNDVPVISAIPDMEFTGSSRNIQIILAHHISDKETPYLNLQVTVAPEAYVIAIGWYFFISIPDDADEISITIYVVDEDGARSNSVTFKITMVRTMAERIGYPYTLPLVLLAAGVASYIVAMRMPRPYSLENLFLIHNDGRLVAHVTKQENTNIDKDVVSAMFTAVQEFVRDSFQQGEVGLKKLEIGDKNVMIEKGRSVYLAMIYSGWPPKDVFGSITMLLRDIEERYEGRIERWNGTSKSVKGVESMLQSFMSYRFKPGSWASEEDIGEEEWVDILSDES